MPASEFDDENESSKEKLEDSEDDGGLSIFGIPIPKIPFPILSFGIFKCSPDSSPIFCQKNENFEVWFSFNSDLVLMKIKIKIEYLKNFLFFWTKGGLKLGEPSVSFSKYSLIFTFCI